MCVAMLTASGQTVAEAAPEQQGMYMSRTLMKHPEIKGEEVPDYINNFFTGIGGKLFSSLGSTPNVCNNAAPLCNRCNPNEDTIVDYSTVIKLLRDIDVHKSSGVEDISATVLKDALMILAPQLTDLIMIAYIMCRSPKNGHLPL